MFYYLNILGWSSSFRAADDLPRAHWDETELRLDDSTKTPQTESLVYKS